mmetsp:Transcript_3033/g.5583  ORF Transcript_3033/g.5583 Transcript_3033/m.5583 type:complete len:1069 (-) Transcript_3033:92-3298(-)
MQLRHIEETAAAAAAAGVAATENVRDAALVGANAGAAAPGAGTVFDRTASKNSRPSLPPGLLPLRGSTPRHVQLRSRVIMERDTKFGPSSRLPPSSLLCAGAFERVPAWCSSCGIEPQRSTHYAGVGPGQIPVELVTAGARIKSVMKTKVQAAKGKALANVFKKSKADGENKNSSTGKGRHKPPPELTSELHMDVKGSLVNICQKSQTSDHQRNPRILRHFLKELQDLCEMLEMPLTGKSYRQPYGFKMLHAFLRLMPEDRKEAVGAELPSKNESQDLPLSGFLPFTILISLYEIKWEFTYNSLTHRICNCAERFPGAMLCLVPETGRADRSKDDGLAESAAVSMAAIVSGMAPGQQSLDERIAILQHQERHFPTRLMDLSQVVKKRFTDFTGQVHGFLEDISTMPLQPGPEMNQRWGRFVSNFSSEVSALDLYYTQFEQLYLSLIDRMIGFAVGPVGGLSGPSVSLVLKHGDPFRPLQTAVLCQRLGLLKQRVSFGGPHKLVHFDPHLLVKAQRVIEMDTYQEVRNLASAMLESFDSLCNVLVNIKHDQIQPEVCENKELRETVLGLEAVWAECQFILHQGALDFIHQILRYIPQLNETCRWELRTAMEGEMETSFLLHYSDNWAEKLKARQQPFGASFGPAKVMATDNAGRILDLFAEGELRADIDPSKFPLILRCKAPDFFAQLDQNTRNAVRESLMKQTDRRESFLKYARYDPFTSHSDRRGSFLKPMKQESDMSTYGFTEEQVEQLRIFFLQQDTISLEEEQTHARTMLFETLPILMYLQELRDDIVLQDQNKESGAPTPFRDLFCPNNERHHMLRRDFAKFDDQRYNKFISFLLGDFEEESESDRLQSRYFRNVYRQLREVAAFPTGDSPAEAIKKATSLQGEGIGISGDAEDRAYKKDLAMAEACARWVCVQRVAQTVKPDLFLENPPPAVLMMHAKRALDKMDSQPKAKQFGNLPFQSLSDPRHQVPSASPGDANQDLSSRRASHSSRHSSVSQQQRKTLQPLRASTLQTQRSTISSTSPTQRSTITIGSPNPRAMSGSPRTSTKPSTAPQHEMKRLTVL